MNNNKGGVIFIFFSEQKLALNQRSGIILEVQIQNFGMCVKVFMLKKPGGLNINIFCENWHEASFYIKEQAQIFLLKFEFSNYM